MNSILNWLCPARAAQRARVIGPWVTSRKPNDYPAMSVQQSQEAREIAQRLAGVFHMDAQELMNQARKMVQGSGFSVLYLLKVWEKTANECPHWVGATKEGASSMDTKSKPITYSSALGGAKSIQTLAEVAINRLKTLEEPQGLVFSELNRDVMEVLKNVCGGSDQKPHAQSVCLPSGGVYIRIGNREKITMPVVTNAELRYSIEQTIWELRGENVAGLSVAVSDRLQKHLDFLLNAEAARVITIIEDEKGAAMPPQQSAADLLDGDAEIIPAKSPQDLKELRDWAAQYLDQLNADMQRHQASVAELTAGGRTRHASLQHKVWQLSAVGQKQTAATLFLSAVESVLDAQKGQS